MRSRPSPANAIGTLGMVASMALGLTACDLPARARWVVDELPVGRTLSAASPGPVADGVGDHDLTVRSDSTATIRVVAGAAGEGTALDFPSSGYVTLQAARPQDLSPGNATIEVQAWVSVTAADLDPAGNNVVQQGTYYQDQWKVQVDGGKPGCRFADGDIRQGAKAALVESPVTVTDGAWWIVTCRKTSDQVAVVVERASGGAPTSTAASSDVGSIVSTAPVLVGSKGIPSDSDQYHGKLDNLEVRIG